MFYRDIYVYKFGPPIKKNKEMNKNYSKYVYIRGGQIGV